MSKNRDSVKRSPGGIIARLMGMEGMPPPPHQPKHKPQNTNHQQGIDYLDFLRNATPYQTSSRTRRSRADQEFKDVFEVVETRLDTSAYPLQRNINSNLTQPKNALFRKKVMDAKCLSTDETLQNSKELHYALQLLDSNKDRFLKCLQEPNSLFKKHLHHLHGPLPQSRCKNVVGRKTSESRNCGNNDKGYISDRETTHTTFCRKYYEDYLNRPYHRSPHNSTPTQIVVLKPNLGMAQSASKSVSSPQSSHSVIPDTRMRPEFQNVKIREPEFRRNKKMSDDEGIRRYKSEESREIGKKITRKMKNSLSATGSLNLSSKFKGYVGDESSCYGSGIDSESESESATLTSRKSFDGNDMHRVSPSHSFDPLSVNREAKQRLANRWKMAHGAQEVGLVGSSSTLGEMLVITDRDAKAEILDNRMFSSGISSKEGWKDANIQNLSRSRSLPTCSSAASGSSKASTPHGTHKDNINLGRNKPIRKHSNQKEQLMSCNSRSDSRKSKFSVYTDREASDVDQKTHVCKNQIKSSIEFNALSEQKIMNSETSICNTPERNLAHWTPSSKSPDVLQTYRPACVSIRDDSPSSDLDIPAVKEISNGPSEEGSITLSSSLGEPESPASSLKEAEQPSPVSVLEAPFSDDRSSGFDCFGSLSADLQGLRMQLQLLKLESEEYNEGRMVISSDEEVNEESTTVTKVRTPFRMEESFLDQSSFVEDVLVESGFYDTDPDTLIATWPIDQSVFQKLENKYSDQTWYSKSEMRLLFDRINSGLFEIVRLGIDPHPWIHKALERKKGVERSSKYNAVEDGLCKLLATQEKKTHEKVLGRESEWLDLEDEMDEIGREVERVLMDELVLEVVSGHLI